MDQKARAGASRGNGDVMAHRQRGRVALVAAPAFAADGDGSGFIDHAPGLLCSAGFDGHFLRLSPAWPRLLGWTHAQLLARPYLDFVHADDRAAAAAHAQRIERSGGGAEFECRLQCRDGSSRWQRWQVHGVPGRPWLHAVVDDLTEVHGLRRALLAAADDERERLGRELHDGLCQNLAGIAALSAALARRLDQAGAATGAADVAEIGALLKQAVVGARDLARGLCPAELRAAGLGAALAVLAGNVGALFGVACTFAADLEVPALGAEADTHLLRIAQEAVHNALVHGRCGRIEITLGSQAGAGLLCIRDDGSGLPADDVVKRSMGLQSMAYRSRLVGGTLAVRRRWPCGTEVCCTFSLPAPGAENGHA